MFLKGVKVDYTTGTVQCYNCSRIHLLSEVLSFNSYKCYCINDTHVYTELYVSDDLLLSEFRKNKTREVHNKKSRGD